MSGMTTGSYNQFDGAFRHVSFSALPPYPYTMHEHFELLWVTEGKLDVTIDKTSVTLRPGDLSLTVPFVFHKNGAAEKVQIQMLSISPQICADGAYVFSKRKPGVPYLRREQVPPLVRQLLEVIPALAGERGTRRWDEKAKASFCVLGHMDCGFLQPYLTVLLLELSRVMELVDSNEHNISAMQKILRYCTANFNQELTRQSVSRECNVSSGLVSQTFRRLGTTFRDYINGLRVNRAYQLLTTTKKPITEIIYECGYSNQGTFNQNFRAQFGRAPRDIRNGK